MEGFVQVMDDSYGIMKGCKNLSIAIYIICMTWALIKTSIVPNCK